MNCPKCDSLMKSTGSHSRKKHGTYIRYLYCERCRTRFTFTDKLRKYLDVYDPTSLIKDEIGDIERICKMLVSRLKKQPVSGGIYDYRKGEFNEELYALMEKHIEPLDFYRVMELVLISYLENNGMKLEKKRFNMDILKGFKQIMNKSAK